MGLKVKQIEAFRAVMREGTMVRASAALAVTQPAVSYLITSLERAIGFPLFLREKGKLTPTTEALQLMTEVDRLYEGIEGVEEAARLIGAHQRAVIRIVLTQALSGKGIVNLIGEFAAGHPGMRLDIDVAHREAIVRRIVSGQADVAFVSLPIATDKVVTSKLFECDLVCVMPKDHSLANRRSVAPRDLQGQALIALKPSGVIRPIVDKWFAQAGVAARIDIEVRDGWTAIELARAGVGVTIVSRLSLAGFDSSALAILPLSPVETIEIGVVMPAGQHVGRSVEALVQFLRANSAQALPGS